MSGSPDLTRRLGKIISVQSLVVRLFAVSYHLFLSGWLPVSGDALKLLDLLLIILPHTLNDKMHHIIKDSRKCVA